jgi:hypothetical protein
MLQLCRERQIRRKPTGDTVTGTDFRFDMTRVVVYVYTVYKAYAICTVNVVYYTYVHGVYKRIYTYSIWPDTQLSISLDMADQR